MKEYTLDNKNNIADYEYVERWLYDDFIARNDRTGLYNNMDIIRRSINDNEALVYRKDGFAEGILVFSTYGKVVKADIISVNPKLRHQGVGKSFVDSYLSYFKKKGFLCVETSDVTIDGRRLCRSTKFKVLSKEYHGDRELKYYKTLVETRKQDWAAKNRIVLWENEVSGEGFPDYSWSMNFNKSKKPIIQHAFKDWYVGVVVDGRCVIRDKLKYLNEEACNTIPGYLYIDEKICKALLAGNHF